MPANLSLFYGVPSLFDRLMNQDEGIPYPIPQEVGKNNFPPVQMLEDNQAVHVRASIPGASLDRVSLKFEEGRLVIQGNLPSPTGVQHRVERPTGPFRRVVKVPCCVLGERIYAVMRNGMLAITMPKPAPQSANSTRRSIPVTVYGGAQ